MKNLTKILYLIILIEIPVTNCLAGWVEVLPRDTCIVEVEAETALPTGYGYSKHLIGYSSNRRYKVMQQFSFWYISGSIYREIPPDIEFMCQNHVPNYQQEPCVLPKDGVKCSSKEFWATYIKFKYGGHNNVGTYWNGTFGGNRPGTYIRTWESTCQVEYNDLVELCGGEENIKNFNDDTCMGECEELDPDANLGGSCPL